MRRRSPWLLLATACLLLLGCKITFVAGPALVSPLRLASFLLELSNDKLSVTLGDEIWVVVDAPAAWTLVASAYDGTSGGQPISGTGQMAATGPDCPFIPVQVPAGFQRLYVSSDGPIPQVTTQDTADVLLDFAVAGAPGTYTLSFWTIGAGTCDGPVTRTVRQAFFFDGFESGNTGGWSATIGGLGV